MRCIFVIRALVVPTRTRQAIGYVQYLPYGTTWRLKYPGNMAPKVPKWHGPCALEPRADSTHECR